MNKLNIEKQASIISALVEGNSIRSTERMTGVHRDTIMRLLVRVGNGCTAIMDQTMRNLPCETIQVDEIWCYVGKKRTSIANTAAEPHLGDQWTYVAIDPDSKLIPNYLVGKRNGKNTRKFLGSLSARMANRVQLSSDALRHYVDEVDAAFGGNVDYASIVKSYEENPVGAGRYSPPRVVSVSKKSLRGSPNFDLISTSHVERQNLNMRMCMRRFTRLTNGFSKKLENLKAAVALHFAHYNFCRIHKTIKVTPAMEIGIVNELWSIQDLIRIAERY